MMELKYVGKTFEEEVETLIGTFANLPFGYTFYDESRFVLVFDSIDEAQEALAHVKHFLFSCKYVDPVTDFNHLVFARRHYSPFSASDAFLRKRDAYLRKMFLVQVKNVERMLKSDLLVFKRRGMTFFFPDAISLAKCMEYVDPVTSPSSPFGFGLLDYRYTGKNAVEFRLKENVPL